MTASPHPQEHRWTSADALLLLTAAIWGVRTSLYSNLTPAIALVTAWLALGETLTLQQAGGAALAVAGVVLARRHARPREDLRSGDG